MQRAEIACTVPNSVPTRKEVADGLGLRPLQFDPRCLQIREFIKCVQ